MTITVFWSYDQYPYVLAAEAELREAGYYVPTYRMYTHKPLAVLEDEDGAYRARRLQELREEHTRKQQALLLEYKQKALEVAPFLYRAQGFKDPELRKPGVNGAVEGRLSSGQPNYDNIKKTRKIP